MNESLFYFSMAAFFAWGITSFITIIDMFRQKTGMGCLGLILFPILPFIWVFTRYSGNKKVIAPILIISAVIAFGGGFYQFNKSNSALGPFYQIAKKTKGLDCSLQSIGNSGGTSRYTISCFEEIPLPENYKDVDGMVRMYEKDIAEPLAIEYFNTVSEEARHNLILAIYTPSGFAVCSKITPNGSLINTWHSGTKELCEE
jgi:hypothetical protein